MLEFKKPKPPAVIISDRRLCLNADKTKVVEVTSEEAAYLLVGEGCAITEELAAEYGLGWDYGRFVLPDATPAEPVAEASAPTTNEQVQGQETT